MTTLTLSPYPFSAAALSVSGGVSEVARAVADGRRRRLLDYFRTVRGQRLFLDPRRVLEEQLASADEMASAGEAFRPSGAALQEAHALIDSLPESLVRPSPWIEPSGAISFEWDFGRDRFAILAVKGTGVLEFSIATAPGERQWGVRNFSGHLDSSVLKLLAEVGAVGLHE